MFPLLKQYRIDDFDVSHWTFWVDSENQFQFMEIQGHGRLQLTADNHSEWFELDITPDPAVSIQLQESPVPTLPESELLLICPGTRHSASITVNGIFEGASYLIHRNALRFQSDAMGAVHIPDPGGRIRGLFGLIRTELKAPTPRLDPFGTELIRLLGAEIRKAVVLPGIPAAYLKLREHLENQSCRKVNLREMMAITRTSRTQLINRFKYYFGATPLEYLIQHRLRRAAEALSLEPQTKISEVAYSVGFNDLSTFNRQFKKHFQITPAEMKRKLLAEDAIKVRS